MRTNPFRGSRVAALALLAPAVLLLAGCNDDETIIYADDNPPAVPTGVYTVTGDEWVQILWNPVREQDMAGYGVYRSNTLDGTYHRIATVNGIESTSYTDYDVTNGTTYYYAVDAFDLAGHESDLSYEAAFDTPRPAGTNVSVFSRQSQPGVSGIDFSDWNRPSFIAAWNAPDTDIYFQEVNGVLFAKGTLIGGYWNDIQDFGWTSSMDDVSWSPDQGWSVAPDGVELIEGHTYVVWTHDNYFAKFRVSTLLRTGPSATPFGAVIDWAYQIDQGNAELSAYFLARKEARNPEDR